MLEICAVASSLTNFKLTWKRATLLTLVRAKLSYLTLLCIDNQHLFLQHHAAIFISVSGGKMDQPGYHPPQIFIESHSNVNLWPGIYLKAYLCHSEPLRESNSVSSLFLGNNRQHMPVCAKVIYSWERNFYVLQRHIGLRVLSKVLQCWWLLWLGFILQSGDWALGIMIMAFLKYDNGMCYIMIIQMPY